jgi:DNA polymerase-1
VLVASLRRRLAAIGPAEAGPELVFFQHDEVIVHCPAALAPEVAAAADQAAAEAGRRLFGSTRVSFPLTTAIVNCYADAK